jgi:MinD-like ATPase involved in chromosome partitioning or flagellar assembly
VECDVVQPSFEQALELEGGVGLLGVLSGSMRARDAVVQTAVANLDVLVAGGASAKAASLLFRSRLSELLDGVGNYDAVLIDSPLPLNRGDYFAGVDHVVVCMKGDGSLIGRAATAVADVKSFGAKSVVIAVTMDESRRNPAEPASVPIEAYARAG